MSELRTLSNAVAMLRLLHGREPVGVTRMAAELEVSTSAAHRIAITLLSEGLLHQEQGTRRYSLASGISFSVTDTELDRCVAIAPEHLSALRDSTNETVHLAVQAGIRVTFPVGIESNAELRISSRVGRSAPLHTAAAGKIMLARFDEDQVRRLLEGRPLEARTERSIRSISALLAELELVRANGYATNIGETEDGVYTLAVPLSGSTGATIAALALSAPIVRMGGPADGSFAFTREPELLREVLTCAHQIGTRLAPKNQAP